jgi:uncharacterized protein (DUF924 family)
MEATYSFWFEEIDPEQWRTFDPSYDRLLAERFSGEQQQATAGELFTWRRSPRGRLMEIVVLDQFSRNIFRGTPQAFAQDGIALALAQEAVAGGVLSELNERERHFLLLPYMHSESRIIHAEADSLFRTYAPASHGFELRHQAIIDRFGRYPHRNAILGRNSTAEELAFLQQPGSSF